MRLGKDFVGKTIISVSDGRRIGAVKDLFVDSQLRQVTGIYLGTEGLFSRKGQCIESMNVVLFGIDAVLVSESDAIIDSTPACEASLWMRRDQVSGQMLITPGGTKVGIIEDVILDPEMNVLGFRLSRTYLTGPIAEKRTVSRQAIVEIGSDNVITVDLSVAEATDVATTDVAATDVEGT